MNTYSKSRIMRSPEKCIQGELPTKSILYIHGYVAVNMLN